MECGRTGRFDCPVEAAARRVVQTDASTALGMTGLLFSGAGDWRVASLLAMTAWVGRRCAVFCGGGWMTRQKRSLPGYFSGVKYLKRLQEPFNEKWKGKADEEVGGLYSGGFERVYCSASERS